MDRTRLLSLMLVAALEASALVSARSQGPVKSPEVSADQRVTFRLRAPNAREVAVAIGGKRLAMQKDEQGLWSLTTDPMAPEFETMFMVPGSAVWLPAPGISRGAIARHAFHSAVADDDRDFFVYTPPGYDPRRSQPYPVLYLLHGLGDDAGRWMNGGAANHILDNLIAQRKAVPMIVVTPLGYGTSTGPAGGRTPENITGYTKILLEEVMPVVDKAYNVSFSSAPMLWAAAVPAAGRGAGRGAGQAPQTMDEAVFAKTFPTLDTKANSRLRMLWIV